MDIYAVTDGDGRPLFLFDGLAGYGDRVVVTKSESSSPL